MQEVLFDSRAGVATLTLNRPHKESNRILGVSTAQWRQVDLQAQLQTTRLADRCCFGIEQSIFAAPHTPNFRLLCASSEGWRVQWESVPPGQKSEPRSLGSRIAWETGILKPTDNVIFWMTASYQAVAKANVRWPRNNFELEAELAERCWSGRRSTAAVDSTPVSNMRVSQTIW